MDLITLKYFKIRTKIHKIKSKDITENIKEFNHWLFEWLFERQNWQTFSKRYEKRSTDNNMNETEDTLSDSADIR